jgi:hypothetical protein
MADSPAFQPIGIMKDNTTAAKLIEDATREYKASLTLRRHRRAALVVRR